eukprot:2299964-Amphidinium_carterae.2
MARCDHQNSNATHLKYMRETCFAIVDVAHCFGVEVLGRQSCRVQWQSLLVHGCLDGWGLVHGAPNTCHHALRIRVRLLAAISHVRPETVVTKAIALPFAVRFKQLVYKLLLPIALC